VTPFDTPFNPGFRFEAPWKVGVEQSQTSFIRFGIALNPFETSLPEGVGKIKDNTLVIAGASTTGDGTVKVDEFKCLGMNFHASLTLCEDDSDPLRLTADPASPSRGADFAPVMLVNVLLRITVDGGIAGSASLTSVTVRFSEVSLPEPPALSLILGGILAFAHAARRRSLSLTGNARRTRG
jgi:hypothetical protein